MGELYRQLLSEQHEVQWLRDGYDAMEEIEKQTPDLILLDIILPWTSGVQLLHELASYTDTAHVPKIIFSSALPEGVTSEALRAYGVVAALDKRTAKPKQVLQTVNDVLTAHANAQN